MKKKHLIKNINQAGEIPDEWKAVLAVSQKVDAAYAAFVAESDALAALLDEDSTLVLTRLRGPSHEARCKERCVRLLESCRGEFAEALKRRRAEQARKELLGKLKLSQEEMEILGLR